VTSATGMHRETSLPSSLVTRIRDRGGKLCRVR
jgi:hypothetical protein